jgi:hypothetical protein
LDNNPLFFHIVSKIVQTLVITYDEIFQALAVEGDVLLPKPLLDCTVHPRLGPLGLRRVWQTGKASPREKPFLDLGFDVVVIWKTPASEMFLQVTKHVKVQGDRVGAVGCVSLGPEMA